MVSFRENDNRIWACGHGSVPRHGPIHSNERETTIARATGT